MKQSDPIKIDGIYYRLNHGNKTAEVTYGNYDKYTGTIVIPRTIDFNDHTYYVVSVGKSAFKDCVKLTSVILSNTTNKIGAYAFSNCTELTSVIITRSIIAIGHCAFRGCLKLKSVTFPIKKRIQNIWFNLKNRIYQTKLLGCRINNIYFRIDVKNRTAEVVELVDEHYAEHIVIPNIVMLYGTSYSVITISKKNSFQGYRYLKSVFIPDTVKTIGDNAFSYSKIKSLTIPDSVTTIGDHAFEGCSELTSVIIPNSVTSIGHCVFKGCSRLESVSIPDSIAAIEFSTFSGCEKLASVSIPNSVTGIWPCAFEGCSSLTSVTIPNSVTAIGYGAFNGCSGLTSITLPNSISTIGENAFHCCHSLKSVIIPDSISTIYRDTFSDCSKLTSVKIPNSVTEISQWAFRNCSVLETVTIPASVMKIDGRAFTGCSKLMNIVVDTDNKAFDSRNNCNAIIKSSTNELIIGCKASVIPNTVVSIGDYAFEDCSDLRTTIIPKSVMSIGHMAFSGCSELSSIVVDPDNMTYDSRNNCNAVITSSTNELVVGCKATIIPNTVVSIGNHAFHGCLNLESIFIPNSISTIGEWAFAGCKNLKSAFIPIYVSSIGHMAFAWCSNLINLVVDSENKTYDSRDKCNAIINKSTNELIVGCRSTIIPNSVIAISDGAFSCRKGLTSVTIPRSVTTIGDYAFFHCSELRNIICSAIEPPTAAHFAFEGVDHNTCKLIVPKLSINSYRYALWWMGFVDISAIEDMDEEE